MLEERNGELYYITDDGTEYQLLECRTMGSKDMTSDIVAIFREDEHGFPVFVNWFAGASMLDGYRDEFIDSCKYFTSNDRRDLVNG